MGPYQLSDQALAAFNAGRYQVWRGEFMSMAADPDGTKEYKRVCVNFARKYHKMYLRTLAYALGKEFPQ